MRDFIYWILDRSSHVQCHSRVKDIKDEPFEDVSQAISTISTKTTTTTRLRQDSSKK